MPSQTGHRRFTRDEARDRTVRRDVLPQGDDFQLTESGQPVKPAEKILGQDKQLNDMQKVHAILKAIFLELNDYHSLFPRSEAVAEQDIVITTFDGNVAGGNQPRLSQNVRQSNVLLFRKNIQQNREYKLWKISVDFANSTFKPEYIERVEIRIDGQPVKPFFEASRVGTATKPIVFDWMTRVYTARKSIEVFGTFLQTDSAVAVQVDIRSELFWWEQKITEVASFRRPQIHLGLLD